MSPIAERKTAFPDTTAGKSADSVPRSAWERVSPPGSAVGQKPAARFPCLSVLFRQVVLAQLLSPAIERLRAPSADGPKTSTWGRFQIRSREICRWRRAWWGRAALAALGGASGRDEVSRTNRSAASGRRRSRRFCAARFPFGSGAEGEREQQAHPRAGAIRDTCLSRHNTRSMTGAAGFAARVFDSGAVQQPQPARQAPAAGISVHDADALSATNSNPPMIAARAIDAKRSLWRMIGILASRGSRSVACRIDRTSPILSDQTAETSPTPGTSCWNLESEVSNRALVAAAGRTLNPSHENPSCQIVPPASLRTPLAPDTVVE